MPMACVVMISASPSPLSLFVYDRLRVPGRTARMGAEGRVTSLLAKRDLVLAAAIEQVCGRRLKGAVCGVCIS